MEIQAVLRRIHLYSPQPQAMADFYAQAYAMSITPLNDSLICRNADRELGLSRGVAHQLKYALFALTSESAWQAFLSRTQRSQHEDLSALAELPEGSVGFKDPDGNLIVFCPPTDAPPAAHRGTPHAPEAALPEAKLQHFALRTQNIEAMVRFYTEQLGYVLSDRVQDEQGQLKACFLRTDRLHHAMALFSAPVTCFDHQSYETSDWNQLKTWADHMGAQRKTIVWGIGRHGPGNDVFFMIQDPDGNLAEISSEIEVCPPERPMGIWRHEERTLNLWGKAIMRS